MYLYLFRAIPLKSVGEEMSILVLGGKKGGSKNGGSKNNPFWYSRGNKSQFWNRLPEFSPPHFLMQ